jgi:hypothetical protein
MLANVAGTGVVRNPAAPESWQIVSEPADLAAIFEPGISVAVHRRGHLPAMACLREASRRPLAASCQAIVGSVAPDHGFRELAHWPVPGVLLRDLAGLIELLALISGAPRMGVRLEEITRRMCPRFHVDRVPIRLVCTYRGPGTEWLPASGVNASALGRPLARPLADGDPAWLPGSPVLRAEPLDVALLKGELWPDRDARALPAVHRSPALPPGESRLVLTLDPIS